MLHTEQTCIDYQQFGWNTHKRLLANSNTQSTVGCCGHGGYGAMTLTNTTLKLDPSATNPAMRSSRGRKQLTLVDNETIRYVSAGAAISGTWRDT